MIIAIVINTSWNIYNFRKGLIDGLRADGHELILIAPRDEYSEEISKWGRYVPLTMDNTGSNPIRDFKLLLQLRGIYAKQRPDIILHYTIKPNIYGTLAARSLGIPCINNVSGLGTLFMNENLTAKIGRLLYRMAFGSGCHILFQNEDDAQDFIDKVKIGVPYSLVPGSGIDTHVYDYHDLPINKVPRFLMVARLLLDKGVSEYLEAALQINEKGHVADFVLAGELDTNHVRGIDRDVIDKYHNSGVVNYLGSVNPIRNEMIKSDWIVLPSYREGTPRTLLEGAAHGRPLITTDVPGCREVVDHGINGFLCTAKSVDSLIKVLEEALTKDKDQMAGMGKESRKIAESKFDEKLVIDIYRNLINNATN
jgi:glycosyltransferase involved in cell wall biosynthesis